MAAVATRIYGSSNKTNISHQRTQALNSSDSKTKSFGAAALELLETRLKDVARGLNYPFAWAGIYYPNSPNADVFSKISATGRDFKNFINATEIPKETVNAAVAVKKFFLAPSTTMARELWKTSTRWVNTTYDGFSFIGNFASPIANGVKFFSPLHYAATFGGSLNGAAQTVQDAWTAQQKTAAKCVLYTLNFFRDFSFACLGGSGLYPIVAPKLVSAAWVITLPANTILAFATAGWAFSCTGFFWEKMVVEPEPAALKGRAAVKA